MKVESYLGEVWKGIEGYEGLYQVSNFGRVKSLERDVYNPRYEIKHLKEKILKAGINIDGHLYVNLYKNGVKKPYLIHRLVAEAFIPNPHNNPIAHHKDHNPLNNNVDNLVWLTHEEHANEHPERNEAVGKAARKARSKHINQFTLDGLFVRAWYSSMDIQRELGYNQGSIIKCCQGKQHHNSAYGYIWGYA